MSHGFTRISADQELIKVDLLVMEVAPAGLRHSQLTEKIDGVFYDVDNEPGHGFLESTYAEAMKLCGNPSESVARALA